MYSTTFPPPFGAQSEQPYNGTPAAAEPVKQYTPPAQGYQKKPWEGQKKQGGGGADSFKRPVETDMSLYKPYAITGNRDMPANLLTTMVEIAKTLERRKYTVRTGGIEGVEEAIELAIEKKELILPFRDFNGKKSKFTYVSDRAMAIAKMFFPSFDTIKKGAQVFLAKNARLVLGNNVASPALFLLCWTEDGVESVRDRTHRTGFTGHPIAIASTIGIPVFNLGNPTAEQRLFLYLESLPNET